jgi:rRNA maturation endonuclease Nob1
MVRDIMQNLCECENCGRIFEKENEDQKACEQCNDPEAAKKQKEKLNKSKYLKHQAWGR